MKHFFWVTVPEKILEGFFLQNQVSFRKVCKKKTLPEVQLWRKAGSRARRVRASRL